MSSGKMTWTKCPPSSDLPGQKNWRSLFLANVTGCDLRPLYDPTEHNLIQAHGPNADANLSSRLYSHLIHSLPDNHGMIQSERLRGDGLALWQAFTGTFTLAPTAQVQQELLRRFMTETRRSSDEDILTYYCRLENDANYINSGANKLINPTFLRTRFLLTLGPEFDFLVKADTEGSLAAFYTEGDIHDVIAKLQQILTNRKSMGLATTTASTLGYANAAVGSPDTADRFSREDRAKLNQVFASQRVERQIETDAALAQGLQNQALDTPPKKDKSYCWTHGISNNPNHTSATCWPYRRAAGHQETATIRNKMGGSKVNNSE
jgi:hypothetical protein